MTAARLRSAAALLVLLLAVGWPLVALGVACAKGRHDWHDLAITGRHLRLLARTMGLAGAATACSLVIALPFVLVSRPRLDRRSSRRWIAPALAVLLCAPMVYAFAWEPFLTTSFRPPVGGVIVIPPPPNAPPVQAPTGNWMPLVRCVVVWSLWSWPIHAVILVTGWRFSGRSLLEAASIDASRRQARRFFARHVVLPWVWLSSTVVFLLLIGEYTVPHACGLTVYATELLSWAAQTTDPLATLVPAIPVVLLAVLLTVAALFAWRRAALTDSAPPLRGGPPGWAATITAWTLLIISLPLPIGVLIWKLASPLPVAETIRTYGVDILMTLAVGLLAGVGALTLALVTGWRNRRIAAAVATLVIAVGVLPGAIIGVAMVAAYNRPWTAGIYDSSVIVALACMARYGWIAVLALALRRRSRNVHIREQALLDGARPWALFRTITWPMEGPTILAVLFVVGALSVGDLAATSLVRVPSYTPIAHLIIEKFHRFEDGILISLSLLVMAAALPAAWLLGRTLPTKPR